MNQWTRLIGAVALAAILAGSATAQTAPTTINFQGRLTRLNGKALPDGQYVVTIRLWKDLTSTNTNDLLITWQNLSVQVRSGVFSTTLPNLTEAVLAGGVAYLEIEPAGQGPLSPRVPLLSVPYAVLAGTVFDNAITKTKIANHAVDADKLAYDYRSFGKLSNSVLQFSPDSNGFYFYGKDQGNGVQSGIVFGDLAFESLIEIGLRNQGFAIGGRHPNLEYAMWIGANDGKVGLGTSSPQFKFHVIGAGVNGGSAAFESTDQPNSVRVIGSSTASSPASLSLIDSAGSSATVLLTGPANGGETNSLAFITNAGTERVRITRNGFVGIGTIDPSVRLDVNGNSNVSGYLSVGNGLLNITHITGADGVAQIKNESTGEWALRGGTVKVYGEAFKPGGGDWANLNSDRRLKKNISLLDNALDSLLGLKGVRYEFKEPDKIGEKRGSHRGFIAQDVERVFPEWVITKPDGYKTISFDSGFDALTVEAMRELKTRNSTLERRVNGLTSENRALKARLDRLERLVLNK